MKTLTAEKTQGQTWPWIGQSRLGAALLTMAERQEWPATSMFVGSTSLGKSTIARWFAQRDLCTAKSAVPCGRCHACQLMANGSHPDYLLIEPQTGERLKIETIQNALQSLIWKRSSTSSHRRWVVMTDIDRLSEHVSNTLLKLIEEPPVGTAILLTTSRPERVLPTILSRAVQFRWQTVSAEELDRAVSAASPTLSTVIRRAIVTRAAGRPGVALTLAREPARLDVEWQSAKDFLTALTSGRLGNGDDINPTEIDRYEEVLRDLILLSVQVPARSWAQKAGELQPVADQLGASRLVSLARRMTDRQRYLTQNVQPLLFLHDLVL